MEFVVGTGDKKKPVEVHLPLGGRASALDAAGRDTAGTLSFLAKAKFLQTLARPRGLEPLFSP